MEITFIPSSMESMVSTYLLTSLAYLWSVALNFIILQREVESIPQDCQVTFQEHT